MGRRIKFTAVFLGVIVVVLAVTNCKNNLLETVESKVVGATSITVDFNYAGVFEISEDMPVILRFYPNPFSGDPETDEKIKDIKITKSDTTIIPGAVLAPSESKKYFIVLFHDLDNNGIEDGIENDALFVDNGDTNIMYDMSSEYRLEFVDDPFYIKVADSVLMSIGKRYSITFADEQDYIDEWEPDNTYTSSIHEISPNSGTHHVHWLGWEDIDYIKLSPTASGSNNHTVTISEFNSNNPVLDISIMIMQGGQLLHVKSNYGVKTFPNSLSVNLNSGEQYFLRVKNPSSSDHGVGSYRFSFTEP